MVVYFVRWNVFTSSLLWGREPHIVLSSNAGPNGPYAVEVRPAANVSRVVRR